MGTVYFLACQDHRQAMMLGKLVTPRGETVDPRQMYEFEGTKDYGNKDGSMWGYVQFFLTSHVGCDIKIVDEHEIDRLDADGSWWYLEEDLFD